MDFPFVKFKFSRMAFLKVFSLTALTALIPRQASGIGDYLNDKNIPEQYIQNRDLPGFHIRSANPFMGVDVENWALVVTGLVKKTVGLTYEDLF